MKYVFLALAFYLAVMEIQSALTNADRKAFLKEQNAIRSKVAKGKIANNGSGGNLPKASNMRQLVWSKKLEAKAAKYIAGCFYTQNAGMTMYVTEGTAETAALLKNATTVWTNTFARYGTQADLTYNTSHVFASDAIPETVYDRYYAVAFVQSIWAKSGKVGCASAVCLNGTVSPLVCMYRAPGLIDLEKIYKTGKPGKKCPKGTKKAKKSGLCKGKGKKGKPIQK
ncbi:putative effector protein [Aphelenchoides bicaudatus]|nr:putative effector protein [Aphelenchoides bicaudatus]